MLDFQLPGYQIVGLLGKGSMGRVYRGRHLASGADVAIKTVESPDPSFLRALANEWEVLLRVEHPYLVNERELITHDGQVCLVMEFIEGVTLKKWLDSVDVQTRREGAGPIMDKACQVLLYLHSQQPPVIVRDLKPDNIMLLSDGTLKLIDFGIARVVPQNSKTELALKGFATAAYAPLEQYSARASTSPASDVYSLGATLFHILAGHEPPSAVDLVSQQLQPQELLRKEGVDAAWASLVGQAMRPKAELRISLKAFHDQLPGKPRLQPPPPRASRFASFLAAARAWLRS